MSDLHNIGEGPEKFRVYFTRTTDDEVRYGHAPVEAQDENDARSQFMDSVDEDEFDIDKVETFKRGSINHPKR